LRVDFGRLTCLRLFMPNKSATAKITPVNSIIIGIQGSDS